MNDKKKILFLCTHNAARSQMAEGIIKARYGDRYEAYSAGSEATNVHPCAVEVMTEVGIDISGQLAKSLDVYRDAPFDYVVTMCPEAQTRCPIFPGAFVPGGVTYIHHGFDDPLLEVAPESALCTPFSRVRDEIYQWIEATFGQP